MYLLFFTISLILIYCSEKSRVRLKKIFYAFLAIFILSVFAGIRDYTLGTDVLLYGKIWFEKSVEFDSFIMFLKKANEYSIGIGYAALNYFVSRISNNFHFFLFVYQFIHLSLIYSTIRLFKSKISITFAFFIYLFTFYNLSYNILRQIMAISIVFFGYRFIKNKKLVKYVITILLACSFHSTAVIGFMLYPISWAITNKKLKEISKTIIIITGLFCVVLFRHIFQYLNTINIMDLNRYTHYLTDEVGGGRFIRLFYWLFICIVLIMCRKRILHNNSYTHLSMYMLISFIFSFICFLGGSFIVRIAYYTDFYQVLYLPMAVQYLPFAFGDDKKKVNYLVIGFVVFMFWLINYVIRNNGCTYPYIFMS